jgi:hypothetical protein
MGNEGSGEDSQESLPSIPLKTFGERRAEILNRMISRMNGISLKKTGAVTARK